MRLGFVKGMIVIVCPVFAGVFMFMGMRRTAVHMFVTVFVEMFMGMGVLVLMAVLFVPVRMFVTVDMLVIVGVQVLVLVFSFHVKSSYSLGYRTLRGLIDQYSKPGSARCQRAVNDRAGPATRALLYGFT
ncbi:MAG TPA: hypothetical protein PK250_09380 [Syntrophobacter fumaroxidans]|nr:hypothetical protein [Syntrophobacter fumaroxidans]